MYCWKNNMENRNKIVLHMKNTVWMAMAFLCLIACKQEPGYEIKGELPGMPDG